MKPTITLFASSALVAAAVACASPARAEAPRVPNGALSTHVRASWVHAWVYGVPLDLADVDAAIGGTIGGRELGVDILGTASFLVGRTDAGRSMSGVAPLGLELRLRYTWLRVGLGARLGSLGVTRSTDGGRESHLFGDAWLGLGVEPLEIGRDGALFVDARGHLMSWGDAAVRGFSIGAGARF